MEKKNWQRVCWRFTGVAAAGLGLLLAGPGSAHAGSTYVPGAIYVGGDETCLDGDLFRAKWWAGPEDHPTDVDVVSQPWETPWERLVVDSSECGAGDTDTLNTSPAVEAYAEVAVIGAAGDMEVDLVAVADDVDGDSLQYFWEQIPSGAPSVAIENSTEPAASVRMPSVVEPVTYGFVVSVSDGVATVSADVFVEQAPVAGNNAPVPVVSVDVVEVVGAGSARLSALGSEDPDGDALSYRWEQVSPESPRATFDDASRVDPTVTFGEPSQDVAYVFEVHVSDGDLSSRAQVVVDHRAEGAATSCPAWDAGAVYVGGDRVIFAGSVWEAHWWTRGEEPGTTGQWGVWRSPDSASCSAGADPVEPDSNPSAPTPPEVDPSEPAAEPAPVGGTGSTINRSDLIAAEEDLTQGPLMASVKDSIRTRDNATVEAVAPNLSTNPENVKRVESIVDADRWDYFFPRRAPEYTYTNFLRAIAKFPAFCGTYGDGRDSDAICRKALATMFAHFTQETGGHTIAWPEPQWRQGLVYVRELGWSEDAANGYGICDPSTWQGATWPCATFPEGHPLAGQHKSYFGRGAKQLSYNYNYGPFSEAMFGDVQVLLDEPNLVADTWLNLASAVFFYVYPQPPKPSMLHALDGTWVPNEHDLAGGLEPGFGVTTQIINGGIECGGSSEHRQSLNRIEYYENFARELGVTIAADEVLGCANMQRFDTQGSGALAIYWEQAWTQPNSCQLVSYQTPFSAFLEGDYAKCVESFFDVTIVEDAS